MKAKALGKLVLGLGVITLGLVLSAGPALADTLQIQCTPTACASGSTTLVTSSGTQGFGVINQDGTLTGTLDIVLLEPNENTTLVGGITGAGTGTTSATSFTSGSVGTFLSLTGTSDLNFSNIVSASAQAGITATNFSVTDYTLTGYSGGGGTSNFATCCSVTAPTGSVVLAFLKTAGTLSVIAQTPLSEGLTTGVVPEPGSVLLLGIGLAGMGLWGWKRGKTPQA